MKDWPPVPKHLSSSEMVRACRDFIDEYIVEFDGTAVRFDDLYEDWISYCDCEDIVLPTDGVRQHFKSLLKRLNIKVAARKQYDGTITIPHMTWRPDALGAIYHPVLPLEPRRYPPLWDDEDECIDSEEVRP